ncbi:hypothetical protein N9M21_03790 [Alphaproteobacteria bacterium]|nr:hypothetical protein [Alphaproteobacteria bacterium]
MIRPLVFFAFISCGLVPIPAQGQISIAGVSWDMSKEQMITALADQGLMAYVDDPSEEYCYNRYGLVGKVPDGSNCARKFPINCLDGYDQACTSQFSQKPCLADGKIDADCMDQDNPQVRFMSFFDPDQFAEEGRKGGARIRLEFDQDHMVLLCQTYNGCDYETKEIAQWLLDQLGNSLKVEDGVVSMTSEYNSPKAPSYGYTYCSRGSMGDRICVEPSYGGNRIVLYKDRFGSGGLTLSLN